MQVEVTVFGDDVVKMLATAEKRTRPASMRLFLRMSAWPWLQQRAVQRFQNEGDDASGKWAELRATTQRIRNRQGYPAAHPINVRTGAMRSFVTSSYRVSGGQGGTQLTMPGKGMPKLIKEKVTRAQQGGYGNPGKSGRGRNFRGPNAPAVPRPVYALGQTDEQAITASLMDWIVSGGSGYF